MIVYLADEELLDNYSRSVKTLYYNYKLYSTVSNEIPEKYFDHSVLKFDNYFRILKGFHDVNRIPLEFCMDIKDFDESNKIKFAKRFDIYIKDIRTSMSSLSIVDYPLDYIAKFKKEPIQLNLNEKIHYFTFGFFVKDGEMYHAPDLIFLNPNKIINKLLNKINNL